VSDAAIKDIFIQLSRETAECKERSYLFMAIERHAWADLEAR
jgi:hypothetical protein